MMDTETIVQQAQALPISGSLTFKMLVVQRDWETVAHLAPTQVDNLHGVSLLTSADREWLRNEARQDGVDLHV